MFNKMHTNTEFYKILNIDCTHHGFKYKNGLNIDTLPFHETHLSGLHFTELYQIGRWILYGVYIAKTTIPDDALICTTEDNTQFKSNKLIVDLNNKILIQDFYAWARIDLCISYMKQNEYSLQFVKHDTIPNDIYEEMCYAAVQTNSVVLIYIKYEKVSMTMYAEICKRAVQQCGWALQFVRDDVLSQNTYIEICEIAIASNPDAYMYVKRNTLSTLH